MRQPDLGAALDNIEAAVGHGTLVYSSWLTMRTRPSTDLDACAANDFALVRVDADDERKVNPSVPFWGGPVGLSTAGAPQGSTVYSWGQSSLRPTDTLSPKTGLSLGRTTGGWGWEVSGQGGLDGLPGILLLDGQQPCHRTQQGRACTAWHGMAQHGTAQHAWMQSSPQKLQKQPSRASPLTHL